MGYIPHTGKVEVVLWGYVGDHSTEHWQSCYVMSLSTGRQTDRHRDVLRMKPTSSRSPALPGPIKQPTRWGCGEAGWSVYPAYRQSSMVGPNACTLQMDHLPTEDGGGSHSADSGMTSCASRSPGTAAAQRCMGRTSGPEMPSCGRRLDLNGERRRKLMSVWPGRGSDMPLSLGTLGDSMRILGSAATNAERNHG